MLISRIFLYQLHHALPSFVGLKQLDELANNVVILAPSTTDIFALHAFALDPTHVSTLAPKYIAIDF